MIAGWLAGCAFAFHFVLGLLVVWLTGLVVQVHGERHIGSESDLSLQAPANVARSAVPHGTRLVHNGPRHAPLLPASPAPCPCLCAVMCVGRACCSPSTFQNSSIAGVVCMSADAMLASRPPSAIGHHWCTDTLAPGGVVRDATGRGRRCVPPLPTSRQILAGAPRRAQATRLNSASS